MISYNDLGFVEFGSCKKSLMPREQLSYVVAGLSPTRCFVAAPFVIGTKTDNHTQAVLDVMPGHLRETSWWSQKRDLHTLLLKFRKSLASDQRDMVYALLGLVSDTSQFQLLRADYNKPILEVIRDTIFTLFFPQHHDISADYNLNWTWHEFSQKLENLSPVRQF